MKLIEKKCPNCGANLKFDNTSKEVTCNYCKAAFLIDRDNKDFIDDFAPEFIKLQAKRVSRIGSLIFIIAFIMFITIFVFFIINFFRISHGGF